jgi:hypothetical protein
MRFFKRWPRKMEARELRLRIDHCRRTMAEVEKALRSEELRPELIEQFRRLGEALAQVDVSEIEGRDLEEIETATNKLLSEFRSLYLQGKLKHIHDGLLH